MFSGIRSLIFGAYEEDSGLSNVQPNVKAAQLLPSLEDQQREEEQRILRESQNDRDVHEGALQHSEEITNFAEDTWELINYEEEESCQKITVSEQDDSQNGKPRNCSDSPSMLLDDDHQSSANCGLPVEQKKDAVEADVVMVAQKIQDNGNPTITVKGKKAKGGKARNHKQAGKLSSPTTTTNTATTTTVIESTPAKLPTNDTEANLDELSEQVVKSNVIPVYTRPSISFAAMAAKNSPSVEILSETSVKQLSCATILSLTQANQRISTISKKENVSLGVGFKRQRPISMSSSSSQSDFNDHIIAESDDESIVSSDFSDCDYDHGYNRDQLVKDTKPRQLNKYKNYRGHASNKSFAEKLSSTSNCSKIGLVDLGNLKQDLSSGKGCGKSTHGLLMKNKKKKSFNESIFSNNRSSLDTVQKPSLVKDACKLKTIQVSKTQQVMGPPPPPPPPTTNNSSGNDSSDAAEMDESWFVTPPSCFDGCKLPKKVSRKNVAQASVKTSINTDNKLKNQKSFGSDTIKSRKNLSPESTDMNQRSSSSTELENLLIEHPSMYIARANEESSQRPKSNHDVKNNQMTIDADLSSRENNNGTHDSKSNDLAKTMKRVVTSAKGKCIIKTSQDISNSREDVLSKDISRNTENVSDSIIHSRINTSVTLLSARPLSSSSSSPSPFSSDDEDNLDNLYRPGTSNHASKKSIDVEAKPASFKATLQKEDDRPILDQEMKENSTMRVMPAVQLMDEHLPYWQKKKKKRYQRRSQANSHKVANKSCSSGKASSCSSNTDFSDCPSLSSSSAGIINRIGSSIVANITNLTTSLPSVQQNVRGIAEEMRKFAENVDNGSQRYPNEQSLIVQRKLAKSHMAKQNKRLASENGNRRVGRKTKMFARANGYSIDRKVQKNFH